ncbi:MAG: rhodanese-like domain-containing protein [Acidimicrobiia bacterium]
MPSLAALLAQARAIVEGLDPAQVEREAHSGALLVDIREPEERNSRGVIPGAVFAPRGMLEFWADPDSPYHRTEFEPSNRVILYCASGGRSALAASTLTDLGYTDVAHLEGGLQAWMESGRPVEMP